MVKSYQWTRSVKCDKFWVWKIEFHRDDTSETTPARPDKIGIKMASSGSETRLVKPNKIKA